MRVIALVLAVSAVALARPQFQLSNKGYEGLQLALDGRVPVAISSGQLLYSAVDNGNDLVVVDLGRAGGPGPAPATFVGADIGGNLLRTDPNSGIGAGINEFGQNVLQFGQGALGFVSDVAVGIGEVAEDTLQGFADLTGIADIRSPDSTFRSLSEGGAPANTIAAAPAGPDLGAAIGQGALLFGQGVLDAVGEVSVGLGQAAEETLRSLSEGVQASSRQAAPAADDTPVASGRTVILVAEPEIVVTITEAPRTPAPTASVSDNTASSLVVSRGVPLSQVAEPVPVATISSEAPAPIPVEAPVLVAIPVPVAVEAIEKAIVAPAAPVTVEATAPVAVEVPVASGRTIIVVAEPEPVIAITESAEPISTVTPSSPAPTTDASTSSPVATESVSTVPLTVTEAAPTVERTGPVAVENTAEVSPTVPEEVIAAPAAIEKAIVATAAPEEVIAAPAAIEKAIVTPTAPEEAIAATAAPEEPVVASAVPEEAIVAPPQPEAKADVATIVTNAGVPLTLLTGSIDQTLNEIVPSAPQDDQNTSLGAAVARTGPVAIEDTAVVALAAPEEAIVAPAAPEAVGVSLAAVTRRKRQVLEEEKPISNARAIGSGLSTLGGLFGSTVGQFMDSVAVAAVEMIDGLENLGTIAIDQVENRFDDNPDNDFFKR